jgi:hypothetical protein
MMIEHNLRKPLLVEDAVHVDRLSLAGEKEVPIVVVADVLLVRARHAVHRPAHRLALPHVPVGDQCVPIGIRMHHEHDHIPQNPSRLLIVCLRQLVDQFDQLLCAEYLVGMKAAVDPHHRLARCGQRAGLGVVGLP